MVIQELFAKLGLDLDAKSFTAGQLALEGMKKGLMALGTLAVAGGAALGALVSRVSEHADKIDEASQSIGINAQALQELAYAASFSGLGMEDMQRSLGILSRTMREAKEGSEEARKSFRDIGIQITDATGELRPMDDVLTDLAERFSKMPAGAEKTALSMKVFGRSGAALIPFLNEGAAGISKLRKEARDLGIVLDENTIKAGVKLDDTLNRVKAALTGVGNELAGALFDDVQKIGDSFLAWVKANREFIRQRLNTVVNAITTAIGLCWDAFRLLTKAVEIGIKHWKLLASVLMGVVLTALVTTTKAQWLLMAASVKAAAASAAAWVVAAAPIVALGVALTAAVAIVWDLYNAFTGAESVIKTAWDILNNFIEDWLNNTDGDGWLMSAVKGLVWGILNLDDVWDMAVQAWKNMINDFVNWAQQKLNDINVFGRFGNWLGEQAAGDTSGGAGWVKGRGIGGGGAGKNAAEAYNWTSAGLQVPASVQARHAAELNVNAAPTINVNGAQDAKAVGEEVSRRMDDWWGQTMRLTGAVSGQ
jgi:hypothetical protein